MFNNNIKGKSQNEGDNTCNKSRSTPLMALLLSLTIISVFIGCMDESPDVNVDYNPIDYNSTPQTSNLTEPLGSNVNGKEDAARIKPGDSILFKDLDSGLTIFPPRGFFMGILPNPGSGQSFEGAYLQASEYCEFSPVWGRPTPFYNLKNDLSGSWGQNFVNKNIRGNRMFPLIHVSFIGENLTLAKPPEMDGEDTNLSDPEWREMYKEAVLDAVKTSKPLYISVGNEVNRWYEKYGTDEENPNGFQHYITLYEEIYDSIKEISPETKVFCTFAREIVSENTEADMSVISMFDSQKIDLIVLTSYPYAVKGINRPSDIPDNYYSKILKNFEDKKLGFSEIGWPSMDSFGGEESQADFLREVTGRLTEEQGVQLELLGWAWLHDLDDNDSIGLIKRDGTEKMSYDVWKLISHS